MILWTGAPWPRTRQEWWGTAAVGVLLQASYLGGVWVAIAAGMPAGISALIVGTQPLFTAALAGTIGERTSARQWAGLLIGFAGVGLVLSDRIALAGVSAQALAANLLALGGITLGTLLQKRIGARVDIRTGSAVQFAASLVITLPLALCCDWGKIDPAPAFWLALAWSILGLSIGAISLLLLLIRRGRATTVASLMYLTPVVTTLLAWLLFGQRLGLFAWLGIAVTMVGVVLATRTPRRA